MQPKISVIIPCWHATEYFDRLYDSIQSQTFKDAEWIFVNDGDASQNEKLQAMTEKDSNIRVLWKENGGVSSARNMGIDEAKGEWIVFIDDDDWFRPYYLESLYSAVKDSDADIAIGGYSDYFTISNRYNLNTVNVEDDRAVTMDAKDAILKLTNIVLLLPPWNKIYKASIIKDNNIKFDPSVKLPQDVVFNMEYYCYCKKISLVKDCGYIYVLNNAVNTIYKYDSCFGQDCTRSLNGYKHVLDTYGLSPNETKKQMTNMCMWTMNAILFNPFRRNHPSFRQAVKEIKEYVLQNEMIMRYYKEYKKNNKLSAGEKYVNFGITTKSATVVALMLKPVFWLKYESPKFYTKIKSLIYRNR